MLRQVRQVAAPVSRVHCVVALGTKSAIFDCILLVTVKSSTLAVCKVFLGE